MSSEAKPLGPGLPPAPQLSAPARTVTAASLVARTFSTWWKRLWIFAALTLVVMVPTFAVSVGIVLAAGMSRGVVSVVVPIVFVFVLWLALFVQASGHTCGAVQHLSGGTVRLGAMLGAGFSRLPAMLGLVLLGLLAYLGVALVFVFVVAVSSYLGGSGFVVRALGVISVPFLFVLGTGLSLTIPVIVAERAGPIAGLRRSWYLTRGHRGAIFVSVLTVALILLAIGAGRFALVMASALGGSGGLFAADLLRSGAVMLLFALVALLAAPLLPIVTAVAYHDLRLEKEGASDLAEVFQ